MIKNIVETGNDNKHLDETVPLQSENRQERIREVRGEKLQGIAKDTNSTPRLANSSAASFPGRNECLETHCTLVVKEEREDSYCQICQRVRVKRKDGREKRVARTERELEREKKGKEKKQTC